MGFWRKCRKAESDINGRNAVNTRDCSYLKVTTSQKSVYLFLRKKAVMMTMQQARAVKYLSFQEVTTNGII